jgi:hypothetical protein
MGNYLWAKPKNGDWECIDSADAVNSKSFLLAEYKLAFGSDWTFQWRTRG